MNTDAIVAVVGPFRSGTSCTAGVLHHLGVSMGDELYGPTASNTKGHFEDIWLAKICRTAYREPAMVATSERRDRVRWLRHWASKGQGIRGGKHPTLCLMIPEMVQAWPSLKVVRVCRPLQDSFASIKRWQSWEHKQAQLTVRNMAATRDQTLHTHNVEFITVHYTDLMDHPAREIERLVKFSGVKTTAEQMADAMEFISPSLCHHRKEK